MVKSGDIIKIKKYRGSVSREIRAVSKENDFWRVIKVVETGCSIYKIKDNTERMFLNKELSNYVGEFMLACPAIQIMFGVSNEN